MNAEPSDWDLLAAWRAGQSEAGNRLVVRYLPVLERFFVNKLAGPIADIVQETFTAAVAARDRIPEEIGFAAYLLGIARNQLRLHARERGYFQRLFTGPISSVARRSATPSQQVAARDEQALLLRALRTLPLAQQTLLELFYWEDLPVREIAVICGIAPGTVQSRLFRARSRLRTALDRLAEAAGASAAALAEIDARLHAREG